MMTMQGPPAMTLPAPPDTAQETVTELSMKLQQAILRDGVISPEEQRALGGLIETMRQKAEQQAAAQMAGQPMAGGDSAGVEPAYAQEGVEDMEGPGEGNEYVPFN